MYEITNCFKSDYAISLLFIFPKLTKKYVWTPYRKYSRVADFRKSNELGHPTLIYII